MIITAKFASVCPCCSGRINVGSSVEWSKGAKAAHVECARSNPHKVTVSAPAPRQSFRSSGAGRAASVRGYSGYCTDRAGCGCYDCAS